MAVLSTLLVVEDDSVLRFLIEEELETAGYNVFASRDAHSAIQMIERNAQLGLMLTDIDLLSKGEGLDLAALVRSRWPTIRIIITSGDWSFRPDELPIAERFLPKPYAEGALLRYVSECLA